MMCELLDNSEKVLLVPSYAKNIGIRRAMSSGNPEELDTNLCLFRSHK